MEIWGGPGAGGRENVGIISLEVPFKATGLTKSN